MNMFKLVYKDNNNYLIPIILPIDNPYSLREIDNLTSKLSEEEFKNYLLYYNLINNKAIELKLTYDKDKYLDILYSNNYCNNKSLYIINFIRFFRNQEINNDLLKLINKSELISDNTKMFFDIIINNYSTYESFSQGYDNVVKLNYTEIRVIYLFVRQLESKLKRINNKKLLKKID